MGELGNLKHAHSDFLYETRNLSQRFTWSLISGIDDPYSLAKLVPNHFYWFHQICVVRNHYRHLKFVLKAIPNEMGSEIYVGSFLFGYMNIHEEEY